MESIQQFIDNYRQITVVSHRNPDADALGTALGIYILLKNYGKRVEVVNIDRELPKNLDFLSHYHRIKHRIDFEESLIIACDSGSIEMLGFDMTGRDILNIDHHQSNTHYGLVNIVKPNYASASCVAYELFKKEFSITKEVATCFYTALVADTQYFSTNNVTKETFDIASDMITFEINMSQIAYHLKQRRTLSSLRILTTALQSLELCCDGELAIMVLTEENIHASGAKSSDLLGIVEYGLSLATVQIAVLVTEMDGGIRVSIRSKQVNVSALALLYGGGGHKHAAGFRTESQAIQRLIVDLKNKIQRLRLINGT